jgi:hypothetical protein
VLCVTGTLLYPQSFVVDVWDMAVQSKAAAAAVGAGVPPPPAAWTDPTLVTFAGVMVLLRSPAALAADVLFDDDEDDADAIEEGNDGNDGNGGKLLSPWAEGAAGGAPLFRARPIAVITNTPSDTVRYSLPGARAWAQLSTSNAAFLNAVMNAGWHAVGGRCGCGRRWWGRRRLCARLCRFMSCPRRWTTARPTPSASWYVGPTSLSFMTLPCRLLARRFGIMGAGACVRGHGVLGQGQWVECGAMRSRG